jgi:hypothetical protein
MPVLDVVWRGVTELSTVCRERALDCVDALLMLVIRCRVVPESSLDWSGGMCLIRLVVISSAASSFASRQRHSRLGAR